MNKCPKCRRPKVEGAKFCRACYAVFTAPVGFTAVSRHNRDARIGSVLIQCFILFLASMAVWLIQADFSFLKAAKERAEQTFAAAKHHSRSLINAGSDTSDQMPDKPASEARVGEGSAERCDAACPEESSSAERRPPHMVVKIGPPESAAALAGPSGSVKQREAVATLISEMPACFTDHVCQGKVRFSKADIGDYWVVGSSSSSSSLLVAADRHASKLLQQFTRGTLEVKLPDDRVRTLRIFQQQRGKKRTEVWQATFPLADQSREMLER